MQEFISTCIFTCATTWQRSQIPTIVCIIVFSTAFESFYFDAIFWAGCLIKCKFGRMSLKPNGKVIRNSFQLVFIKEMHIRIALSIHLSEIEVLFSINYSYIIWKFLPRIDSICWYILFGERFFALDQNTDPYAGCAWQYQWMNPMTIVVCNLNAKFNKFPFPTYFKKIWNILSYYQIRYCLYFSLRKLIMHFH